MSKKYLPCYLLGFILLSALFLQIWGLDYGLPYFLVNDEKALVYGALKMGELKTLIPSFHPEEFSVVNYKYNFLISYVYLIFLIPFVLVFYLVGSFANFTELTNYFILNPGPVWLFCRVINALIGVATVYLVYLIGKNIWNRWIGLISASFFTLSFLQIQLSHFTRPWVPMAFFTCLVMLLSVYIYRSHQRKHYILMGVVLGLAFGITVAMAVIMMIFFLAHFLSTPLEVNGARWKDKENKPLTGSNKFSFWQKLKNKNLWLSLLIFFLLVVVFSLINPETFSMLAWGGESLMSGKSLGGYLQCFVSHFKALFFFEPIILIFSLLGVVLLWFKSKKLSFIALSWPVFYISTLYFFSYPEFFSEADLQVRYILLILPWLALLAGFTVYHLTLKLQNPIKIIFVILLFIYPLVVGIQYDYLLSQKDTRILALEWVEENIPAGAKIISTWSPINPIPTKEAILFQKELDESSLRVRDEALLNLKDEEYPQPAYDILRLAYVDREKWVLPQDYQYFLVAFWQEDELSSAEKLLIEKTQLIREFRQSQARKSEDIHGNHFLQPISILFSLERLGPTVKIYEIIIPFQR